MKLHAVISIFQMNHIFSLNEFFNETSQNRKKE